MIDRWSFLATTSMVLLAVAPLAAGAQPAGKVYRVGILSPGSGASSGTSPDTVFHQGLRDLGWIEGRNIVIERRSAEWRFERLPDLAAELVRLKVDVILAGGDPAALKAARDAMKTIPIVMVASSSDPIREGIIKSFALPGGNITGLVTAPEGLGGKR